MTPFEKPEIEVVAPEPPRFPRALAIEVAEELFLHLAPACVPDLADPKKPALRIVGSTRRGKETVKDLELLFISAVSTILDPDSLIGDTLEVPTVHLITDDLVKRGILAKRPKVNGTTTWGDSIRLAVHVRTGLPVDLFAASAANWFNQLVCRTGGKANNVLIATRAQERGMHWEPFGPGFTRRGKPCRTVRSEQDVYQIVDLPYPEPHQRK